MMTDYASHRILIVDDDIEHVAMLSEYLGAEGFLCDGVYNGFDALAAIDQGRADAMILDVMMPKMLGSDVLRTVRQTSDLPVIMLTAKGDDIERVIGLELGADDYIAKPFFPRELVARLRAVLRRQSKRAVSADTVLTNGRIRLNPLSREASIAGVPLDLTASEFNVLAALLANLGNVVSKDDLSLIALRRQRSSYDRSIDVHISNLRLKFADVGGEEHGIETARGVGYRIVAVP